MGTKLKDYDRFTQTAEGMIVTRKGGMQKSEKQAKPAKGNQKKSGK